MTAAQVIVAVSFAAAFTVWCLQWLRAQRNRDEGGRVVNPAAKVGALLEAAGFVVLATVDSVVISLWLTWTGAALAVLSAGFGIAAGRHLGNQFRVQAVVTDHHRLIQTGPYSVVRHPIYATLLGFLVAFAFANGRLMGLAVALPVFLVGTEIRVRAEDKILRQRFGEEFTRYAARVAAYIPGLR